MRTQRTTGKSLGQPIATVATPLPATPGAVDRSTTSPEDIQLAAPPPPRASRTRAILAVATEFAHAYLRYQIGQHPKPVEKTIRATATPSFVRLLLAQPATIPPGDRTDPAFQPAALTSITYTGSASLGPGPPTQIAIAAYRVIGHPTIRGQLTIHLTPADGGWRVASLG